MLPLRNSLTRRIAVPWMRQALFCHFVLALVSTPLQAQQLERFPVTPEQVALAMQGRGWSTEGVQIRLAVPVTTTTADPTLQIESVSTVAAHEVLLRVRCRVHTECLSFFASAVWPTNGPIPRLAADFASRGGSADGAEVLAGSASWASASAAGVIRAGSPVTLLLEGTRIQIRLQVVFAQNGHVGDTVRVTTPDRKQTYVAEVLTPGLVRGQF